MEETVEIAEDLGLRELAALLGVSYHKAARLRRGGVFPGAYRIGRQWKIPASDLRDYLAGIRAGVAVDAARVVGRQAVMRAGLRARTRHATEMMDAMADCLLIRDQLEPLYEDRDANRVRIDFLEAELGLIADRVRELHGAVLHIKAAVPEIIAELDTEPE